MKKQKYNLEINSYLVVKIDAMFDLYIVKIIKTLPLVVMASESDRHRLNSISAERFKIEESLSAALQKDLRNKTEKIFEIIGKNLSLVTELPEFGENNPRILIEVTKLKLN